MSFCIILVLVRIFTESAHLCYVCLPANMSAFISTGPSGLIFMKFDIGDFYENLSKENPYLIKIGQNDGGTLREERSMIYCCQ